MVLKANDRHTSCPCHDEFCGPRSDYVRQVALENNINMKVYLGADRERLKSGIKVKPTQATVLELAERGPTAVFGAKKRQIEDFQKGVNDEKLLGSACVSGGGMKWAFRKDEIE
ncbi:hypothetical protein TNCV_2266851 [Trichonephila clavipes]|nr:hypothetical protein TNCV_2266851 [Trichonephila clavipes]